jgi:hypothetical protein
VVILRWEAYGKFQIEGLDYSGLDYSVSGNSDRFGSGRKFPADGLGRCITCQAFTTKECSVESGTEYACKNTAEYRAGGRGLGMW